MDVSIIEIGNHDQSKNPFFLLFHSDYTDVHLGLFRGIECLGTFSEHHKKISEQLFVYLDTLLRPHKLTVADMAFLAAHKGPGPFTTLRTLLSCVNGLSFSRAIPLVGLDGFELFFDEMAVTLTDVPASVHGVVLNAFCNDVYYAFREIETGETQTGCTSHQSWLEMLRNLAAYRIVLAGAEKIIDDLNAQPIYEHCTGASPHIESPSLQTCAHRALAEWLLRQAQDEREQKPCENQLFPLYLKPPLMRPAQKIDAI
jgi:tRNA A37 threonylcarbamoyladenosine modification protein TsaB